MQKYKNKQCTLLVYLQALEMNFDNDKRSKEPEKEHPQKPQQEPSSESDYMNLRQLLQLDLLQDYNQDNNNKKQFIDHLNTSKKRGRKRGGNQKLFI